MKKSSVPVQINHTIGKNHKFASSPVTLGGCEHIFCSACCEAYLGKCCPECQIPAHVKDAEVDRQLSSLASLCAQLRKVLDCEAQKLDEEVPFESTPQQPIPGAWSHDHHQLQTNTSQQDFDQSESNKTVNLPDFTTDKPVEQLLPQRSNRKTRKSHDSKVDQAVKQTATSNDKGQMKKGDKFLKRKKQGTGANCSKRRKSLPAELPSFNQTNEDDELGQKQGEASETSNKISVSRKRSKKELNSRKPDRILTRLRHSTGGDSLADTSNAVSKTDQGGNVVMTDSKSKKVIASDMSEHDTRTISKLKKARKSSEEKDSPGMSRASSKTQPVALCKGGAKGKNITPKRLKTSETCKSRVHSPALNKRNAKGETPLQVAAIKNDVARVQELLEQGANPNVRDNAGWTPLHEACNHGYIEIAKLLLDNGAMINVPGLENDTPLHDAINNNRVECVKLLVSRGASQTLRNMHGQTAVDLAVSDVLKAALETRARTDNTSSVTQVIDPLEYQEPCLLGTGLSREEKVQLQKTAARLQVKLADDYSPEVTHVVTKCNSKGQCPRTIKILQGILTGKWILGTEWLETCSQVSSLVCEEAFEVQGTSLFPDSLAPTKGRTNRKQQLPGLFDGCKFYFHGNFEYAVPSKEDLTDVILAGGGKILTREPKPGHIEDDMLTVPYHAEADGELAHCCVYLIHDNQAPLTPVRTRTIVSASSSWIMDSAANFKLMPLPALSQTN